MSMRRWQEVWTVSKAFIVLWMIFFHIVDDYYLQGWLASAKQKQWWKENAPQPLYKYDYIWALLMHSFSWAFMIMLPIAISMEFQCPIGFIFAFLVNFIVHALVDNMKANERRINLICDQSIHIAQIILTFLAFTWRAKKKGANTNPGKPGSQKIDKSEVKLFVTAWKPYGK